MRKIFCAAALACLTFLTGCSESGMTADSSSAQLQEYASDRNDTATVATISFVSGMGCSDPDCTDATHHHDCPADCGDYEHHHSCALDCTDASHHHAGADHAEKHHADSQAAAAVSFVSGMGCSDPDCTDATHHHDCPADCGDYEHHHSCGLDCTDASHHHAGADHTEEHHADSAAVTATTFVSGMGCSDPNCTDATHHHDCPADCGDYEHHHSCGLDCTDASHHHAGVGGGNESGKHHGSSHH